MNANGRTGPEYKYLDLVIRSFQESSTVTRRQLRFEDYRDVPIVNDASAYKLSVQRFSIDTFQLPCLFFQIKRNQANANLGAYSVTLEYDDNLGAPYPTSGETNLIWVPQNADIPAPPAPDANPNDLQIFDEYYWAYSWEHLIDIVNTTFETAMTALIAAVPALAGVQPPWLSWNAESQTATLYARESPFNTDAFPRINIYFNRTLYSIFNSFNFLSFDAPVAVGMEKRLIVRPYSGSKVVTLPFFGSDDLIYHTQEVTTVANMSPVSSVLFTSSTLPVVSNDMSLPMIFLDGNQLALGKTYSNTENVISDFETDEDGYRPSLLYTPNEFRYISMYNNNTPIKMVDINVWWKDYLGILRPFYLPPGASASIKILFKRLDDGERERTHN